MERQWWKGKMKDIDVHKFGGEEGRCGQTTKGKMKNGKLFSCLWFSIMWEEEIKAEET